MELLDFEALQEAVSKQLNKMLRSGGKLFVVDGDKHEIWDTYLDSFPEGTNEVFKERREYDCQCCKQFIRQAGYVVTITEDYELMSIWDFEIGAQFGPVVKALAKLVHSKSVKQPFWIPQALVGTVFNYDDDGNKWNHFNYVFPDELVKSEQQMGPAISKAVAAQQTFKRSLDELTTNACDTVLELIAQNILYRGAEHKNAVVAFKQDKIAYMGQEFKTDKEADLFCWYHAKHGIRNSVIGTLLTDLSDDVDLDKALRAFEIKVAPQNYKRPTAKITPAMIKRAKETITELGFLPAMERRYAIVDDLTINNVLYADRNTAPALDVFDELTKKASVNTAPPKLGKIDSMSIADFMENVLPTCTKLEVLFEGEQQSNLVSLIAPIHENAPGMFLWPNNFGWAYKDGVADSLLKDKVQALGGRVDGVFRFTHSWNELEANQSLMDLHVFMPGNNHCEDGKHDKYGKGRRVGWNRRRDPNSGGDQDVDYTNRAPVGYVPVENITFPSIDKMPEGDYICKIHNWDYRASGGKGTAEIEFGGNIYSYVYPATKHKEWITIATVTLKDGKFSIKHHLPESKASKEVWGINTNNFHKVNMVMHSPNHWDDNNVGNKHYFFIVDGCLNPETSRGFFNEFLNEKLTEHRKTLEVLGETLQVAESDNQLSGLGFSSTVRNTLTVRATGKFNRTININF